MNNHASTQDKRLVSTAAHQLRELLHERRTSQRKLASELGVAPGVIHHRVSGLTPLTLDDIEQLARHFDVPVTYFLGEPAPSQEQRSLHLVRHDATVEAAIKYSLDNGGERVTLSDDFGLTIIEGGHVVATVARQDPTHLTREYDGHGRLTGELRTSRSVTQDDWAEIEHYANTAGVNA